jgi:hypothetical protein
MKIDIFMRDRCDSLTTRRVFETRSCGGGIFQPAEAARPGGSGCGLHLAISGAIYILGSHMGTLCVLQQILLSGFGGRKARSSMGKLSTAEVPSARLRTGSSTLRHKRYVTR